MVRAAAAKSVQKAMELKRAEISLMEPLPGLGRGLWRHALEGALLAAYKFTKYKTEKGADLASIEIVGEEAKLPEAQRVLDLCEVLWLTRDWSTKTPMLFSPTPSRVRPAR